jgi:hypothetical protein
MMTARRILATGTLVLGSLVATATKSAMPAAPADLNMRIEAEGLRAETQPLLPVCLTITVENARASTTSLFPLGSESLSALKSLQAAGPSGTATDILYRFSVSGPDGSWRQVLMADWAPLGYIVGGNARPSPAPRAALLGPGEKWVRDYCLGFGYIPENEPAAGPIFPGPGDYTVFLEMACPGAEPVKSNSIQVRVDEPASADDGRALDILSSSDHPHILLAPPGGQSGSPFLHDLRFPVAAAVTATAERIVGECPDSTYASYAKLLLARALVEKGVEATDSATADPADSGKAIEGYRMLRACAEDPILPRRYRESALILLAEGAATLANNVQYLSKTAGGASIAGILGVQEIDLGGTEPEYVLEAVRVLSENPDSRGALGLLKRTSLTPEQIDQLKAALRDNQEFALAHGVSDVQKELRDHAEWARKELGRLPWRDPATGGLLW